MAELKTEVDNLLNEFNKKDERDLKIKEWIENLPEDKLMEALKAMNPYGIVLPVTAKADESISLSYTNMRLEFTKRLVATSMIGFVMKMLKEYNTPEEVQPVDMDEYIKNPSIADPPVYVKDAGMLKKYAEYKESMADRVKIWTFFKHIFDFDPDKHVTSALQTNTKDPTRKHPDTAAVRRAISGRKNTARPAVKRESYEATVTDLTPADALTEEERAAYTIIPPLDTFCRYDRYLEEHYEQYMACVKEMYGAQPDVDFCVIAYDKHDNADQAKAFKEKYMEQVIAPITNIKKNKWVALGPYRENREKVDFFNRHTEVLREMLDQREKDSHVATDIMKKRITRKKAENIAADGPDDRDFRRYLKANKPAIAGMGGEHVTEKDESDDDCPENAVEVNVFQLGDGGREMKVHKIYNPVEAPTGQERKDNIIRTELK